MEDHPLRCALLDQHPQHVLVGVAVVDDQRRPGALGDGDVRPERLLLQAASVGALGPEVVQPGLPDRHDRRERRQRLDLAQGLVGRGAESGLVGVQCDGRVDLRVAGRQLSPPPAARHVDPDLYDRADPDGPGDGEGLVDVDAHDVEVGVAVQDLDGQRLRGGRRLALPVRSRTPCSAAHGAAASSRASSSSTTDGSSLANSGTGLSTTWPTLIGRRAQTASVA